jgi:tetratricopeptide (TPR) repeat protein
MRKIIAGHIFLFFLLNSVQAQQHLVDSITKELLQPMPDTNRAVSIMRLAIDYELVDTAKAYQAYRDAINFARKKNLYYNLGRIYQNQAVLFSTGGNDVQAKVSLDSAIFFYQKSDNPKAKKFEANTYNDLANRFKKQNELQQSVQYYLKGIAMLGWLHLIVMFQHFLETSKSILSKMNMHIKQSLLLKNPAQVKNSLWLI